VLYPTGGLLLFSVPDGELLSAVFRAYNDWIAEFCRACPRRLKGIALIDVDDIPGAIKELEHARKLGLAGALRAAALSQRRDVPGRFQPGGGRRQCADSGHSPKWGVAEKFDR